MSGPARQVSTITAVLGALLSVTPLGASAADGVGSAAPTVASPWRTPWSADAPRVVADVRAGRPFVTRVVVPLCSNEQIDCGSRVAGDPGSPETNLYWGAVFGVRRHFDRLDRVWERVYAEGPPSDRLLERIVYRRWVDARRWGAAGKVEQIVVLEAVHGSAIRDAAADFWALAASGGEVAFVDGGRSRREVVHVAGYAGHNELSPGYRRARGRLAERSGAPIAAFALGCQTEGHAADRLADLGAHAVVTTRQNMAPEGYVVDAVVRALGDNATKSLLRARVVASYARFQRIPESQASWVFSRSR